MVFKMIIKTKNKINLLNLNILSLERLTYFINEKKFFTSQILNWIYKYDISNINDFKNIKINVRKFLSKISEIKSSIIMKEIIDVDNTIKWLIKLDKSNIIETVAIPNNKNHFSLCISSQVGCALNCDFCITGKNGFLRNLKCYEIVSQIYLANKRLNTIFSKKKITNIVAMGMGEPLLNIDNIESFIDIICSKNTYNINKKKITISTSGIIPGIKIMKRIKVPLALSLHFTDNNLRSKIMPINKKYPILDVMKMCKDYGKTNDLTIEYIMLDNINDSTNNAYDLVKLLNNVRCKICLIPFNYIPNSIYKPSSLDNIFKFQKILIKSGFVTNIRKRKGFSINAACGQLSGFFNHRDS
jgi:23S rRNA (adenine2503-C2)-methyltransferase